MKAIIFLVILINLSVFANEDSNSSEVTDFVNEAFESEEEQEGKKAKPVEGLTDSISDLFKGKGE